MRANKSKTSSILLLISILSVIIVHSCSMREKPFSYNPEQDKYLELSSYDSDYLLSSEDVYSFGLALGRFGLYIDGNELKYRAKSANEINISPELFYFIEEMIQNEKLITRTSGAPSDCVAKSLSLWGLYSYQTINNYITQEYGENGVPQDKVLDVIKHFYPNAQPHYLDTNDIDFSVGVMTTVGVMRTNDQYSWHMVNISKIDSLGNVTYFDYQNDRVDINSTSDYTVFYTKE